jgi:hypothetical protein
MSAVTALVYTLSLCMDYRELHEVCMKQGTNGWRYLADGHGTGPKLLIYAWCLDKKNISDSKLIHLPYPCQLRLLSGL